MTEDIFRDDVCISRWLAQHAQCARLRFHRSRDKTEISEISFAARVGRRDMFDERIRVENYSDKDASRLQPMFTRAICIVLKV
jgi:hypothetical protein